MCELDRDGVLLERSWWSTLVDQDALWESSWRVAEVFFLDFRSNDRGMIETPRAFYIERCGDRGSRDSTFTERINISLE